MITVLTASIGERRPSIYTPAVDARPDGVRYIAFVDKPSPSRFWEQVLVERADDDSCRDAKRYKVLARNYVPEGTTATLWIDRHCRLRVHPAEFFDRFTEDVGLVNHWRRCLYWESRAVISGRKDDPETVRKMVDRFRLEGFPARAGLYFGGFIARRLSADEDRFSRLWWNYIETGSRRDQLSLPVALDRSGVSFRAFSGHREFFGVGGK